MLTLTPSAAARLSLLLNETSGNRAARIVRHDQRLKLRCDRARAGDTTFAHEGRVVLVLDARMAKSLGSRTLDTRETDTGPRLRVKAR